MTTETGEVARRGAGMAVGALASRITGFVRTAAIGAVLGAGLVGDAYATATMLPGIIYEVLVGGTIAGIIVSLLVRARQHDDGGRAYTDRILTMAGGVFALLAVLLTLASPLIAGLMSDRATAPASEHLVTVWTYLVMPTIFFYGIGALLTAVLNANDHFATPTWAPIANNLTLIVTAAIFLLLPGPKTLNPENITPAQVWVLGVGTLIAVILQTVVLWPALRRVGWRWQPRLDARRAELAVLGRLAGWTLLYLGVSQIGVLVVLKLARVAGDRGGPGPAIYANGYLMLMMGYGVAALPIITALVPRMSAVAAERRLRDAADELSRGARLISIVLTPAAVGFAVLGGPIAVTVFQWGRYTHDQALATGLVIAVAGLGLLPYAISQLQTFAFFALADVRTPALLNIPVVAVRIAVDLAAVLLLPARWVALGLMAGNAISYLAAALAGGWLLRRRLGRPTDMRTRQTVLALVVPTVFSAGAAWACTAILGDSSKVTGIGTLLAAGVALLAIYALTAAAIVPEVREAVSSRWTAGRERRR